MKSLMPRMDLRELHAPLLQGEWESPADPDTFSDEGQVPLETANDESDMEDIPNELDVAEDEEAQELRLNRSSSVGDSPSPPAGLGSFAGLSAGLLAAAAKYGSTKISKDYIKMRRSRHMRHTSLCCFTASNPFRKFLNKIVLSRTFHLIMALIVTINAIALAFYNPVDGDDTRNAAVDIVCVICDIIFILEATMKIIAHGLLLHTNAYLRNGWNVFEAIVAVFSALELLGLTQKEALTPVVIVAVYARALRPLRILRYIPKLRILTEALIRSFPNVLSVAALLIIFYTILALIGTELFGFTLLQHCVGPDDPPGVFEDDTCFLPHNEADMPVLGGRNCADFNKTCMVTNYNPIYNTTSFDNFPSSFLMVFQSVTLEGWTQIAYFAMNANGALAVIYFLPLPLVGTFFFQNLYLATVQNLYGRVQKDFTRKAQIKVPKAAAALVHAWRRFKLWLRRPAPGSPLSRHWWYRLGRFVDERILQTTWFRWITISSIIMSVVILLLKFYGQPKIYEQILMALNIVFLVLFTIEIVLKFIGYGALRFVSSPLTLLDAVVVVTGWIELAIGDNRSALIVLRGFRLLQVLKLSGWQQLRRLSDLLSKTLPALAYILLLMLIIMYSFTLLGMELFGGRFDFPEGRPGLHYDSFWNAFTSAFSILGVEAWNEAMANGVRALQSRAAAFYFAAILAVPNYIILNLFLSVLLAQFSDSAKEARLKKQEEEEAERKMINEASHVSAIDVESTLAGVGGITSPSIGYALMTEEMAETNDPNDDAMDVTDHTTRNSHDVLVGHTLCCIPADSIVRRWSHRLLQSRIYKVITAIFIIASCISIIIEKSGAAFISNNPKFAAEVFYDLDIFFFIVFFLDAILHIITYGLIRNKDAYLRNAWNWVDLLSVAGLGVSLFLSRTHGFLRTFLALRPVRLLTRFRSTRAILHALWLALPSLPAVLPIALFVWVVYAALGVQLFSGKMGMCNDETIDWKADCVGQFVDPETNEIKDRVWEVPHNNFDNVIQAIFTIFKCSTGEGWPEVLANVMMVVDVDHSRRPGASPASALYFMGFVPMCIWFVTGLVIGVVVDAFDEIRSSASDESGTVFTQDQRRWIQLQQIMIAAFPRVDSPPPTNKFRQLFYDLIGNRWFDYCVMMIVVINTFIMCFSTNDHAPYWESYRSIVDVIFTIIYCIEFIIRLIAIGPTKDFFLDGWNVLDGLVLLATFIGWAIGGEAGRLLQLAKVFRLFKITRLIKRLRVLFKTLTISLPTMLRAFIVLLVILFVFATIGVYLFEDVTTGEEINSRANFNDFGSALFLMYRMSTGEAWEVIMHDVMKATSNWAVIYFIVFTIIVTFVITNLFIAIMLDNFSFVTKIEEGDITLEDVTRFINTWKSIDSENRGHIHVRLLPRLLRNLKPPFGVGLEASPKETMELIRKLNVKVYGKWKVRFPDLLLALSQLAIGIESIPSHIYETASLKISSRWEQYQRRANMTPERLDEPCDPNVKLVEVVAASIIQDEWRKRQVQKTRKSNSPLVIPSHK